MVSRLKAALATLLDRIDYVNGDDAREVVAEVHAATAAAEHDALMKGAQIGYTYGALGRDFAGVLPEIRRVEEGTDEERTVSNG